MTRLADHRRFAAATALTVVAGCGVLSVLLLVTGRAEAVPGLAAGTGVALLDVGLLARGLGRAQRRGLTAVGARALAAATFVRFLTVCGVIGVVICARGLNPVGVVVGFMLLPAAIVAVGAASLRGSTRPATGRLDAAAR